MGVVAHMSHSCGPEHECRDNLKIPAFLIHLLEEL